MVFNNPKNYIVKNKITLSMYILILIVYTTLVLVTYNLYFIKSYHVDKPSKAEEMAEQFRSQTYQPEAVKLIPVMSRTISTDFDRDIAKVLNTECKSIELTFNLKTLDPLLTNRTDVSIEVENTGPKFQDCNLTITAIDRIN